MLIAIGGFDYSTLTDVACAHRVGCIAGILADSKPASVTSSFPHRRESRIGPWRRSESPPLKPRTAFSRTTGRRPAPSVARTYFASARSTKSSLSCPQKLSPSTIYQGEPNTLAAIASPVYCSYSFCTVAVCDDFHKAAPS